MSPSPISISSNNQDKLLPSALQELIELRLKSDLILTSDELLEELNLGIPGHNSELVLSSLQKTLNSSLLLEQSNQLSKELLARCLYLKAWTLGRLCEFDGTVDVPLALTKALSIYQKAFDLLQLPSPPLLSEIPSVTRPNQVKNLIHLAEVEGWIGEFLAEFARSQTTLIFSSLIVQEKVIQEEVLAELLDLSCRRNVQALFTPLSSPSPSEDPASTVMGNSRLIKDMINMFPFSTSSSIIWNKRIDFATHVADVEFVSASMSAERLVESASASATLLQQHTTSSGKGTKSKEEIKTINEVRKVLEATVRRLIPFEKKQGSCLLGLGRVMLEAIGAIYLGKTEGSSKRGDSEEVNEEEQEVDVPENDLVKECRQCFIRAAGLFENVYASFRRAPSTSKSNKAEKRLLRRLETTYCLLEELDNSTPEVISLRADRVDRAMWINDRLIQLGDINNDEVEEGDESDYEADGSSDSSDEDGAFGEASTGTIKSKSVVTVDKDKEELEKKLEKIIL